MLKTRKAMTFLKYLVCLCFMLYPLYLYLYVYRDIPNTTARQPPPPPSSDDATVTLKKDTRYVGNCLTDNVERNVDNNHRDLNRAFWDQLSEVSMARYKSGWREFVQKEKTRPVPTWTEKQGIVFVAGNDDTLKRTMGTIRLLQTEFNCTLPIEIWHMENEAETAALFENEVRSFQNVQLRDLSDFGLVRSISRMRNRSKQFQVKAAAIINSRFRHVLYLDSDNIPTRDPAFLFETAEYKKTGAIFWPDFWKTAADNKIFKILHIQCTDTWEQESGQIVVDKRKHWIPLQLAWFMQFYHELYFRLLNGDKDTFQYAWQALGASFHRIETFVAMGGLEIDGQFCGHSMLQYMDGHDSNKPLFVHANLMKQIPEKVFMKQQQQQRPWRLIKRYRNDKSNLFLSPEFYMVKDRRTDTTMGCMNFKRPLPHESDSYVVSFDEVLGGFQDTYFQLGGIGGYV